MVVKFHCPHCDGSLETEANVSGYESECPHCGKTIKTPGMGIYPGLVIDDMRIEKALGRGSMGEVYLATQVILERKVALKILNASLMSNPQAVERFMKEVRLLARLHHPNIVAAYSAGESLGVHYLAMSYVKGETMAARLQRKNFLPEDDALAVALCVARALNYAWERHHLLHRDIKPGNIMVDQDGEIKLMDMGLSKSLLDDGEGTQAGMLLGTPHYMSPEQADCRSDIDCRADIYGLGATLYHMVTGSPPYPGSNVPDIVQAQLKAQLPPVRDRNPKVTKSTAALIEKMMEKDRGKRHASWDELIADISRILIEEFPQSDAGLALPAQPSQTAEVPRQRRSLIPFLLLILLGIGGADYWLMKHPADATRLHEFIADALGRAKDLNPHDVKKHHPGSANDRAPAATPRNGPMLELVAKRIERARKNGEMPPLLERLPAAKLEALIEAMKKLDEKAAPLIRENRLVEAAKLYEDYNGEFAQETMLGRRAAAHQLLDGAIHATNAPPR
jgi:serine/threonine-protein kinase